MNPIATVQFRSKYINGRCDVFVREYGNGVPAIELVDAETGEKQIVASVNVVEHAHELDLDETFIKTWDANEGVLEELQRLGIVSSTIEEIRVGPFNCVAARVQILKGGQKCHA